MVFQAYGGFFLSAGMDNVPNPTCFIGCHEVVKEAG